MVIRRLGSATRMRQSRSRQLEEMGTEAGNSYSTCQVPQSVLLLMQLASLVHCMQAAARAAVH